MIKECICKDLGSVSFNSNSVVCIKEISVFRVERERIVSSIPTLAIHESCQKTFDGASEPIY